MSFPELTAFARNFEATPVDDHEEQSHNLARVRELAWYVRSKNIVELAACLESVDRKSVV